MTDSNSLESSCIDNNSNLQVINKSLDILLAVKHNLIA